MTNTNKSSRKEEREWQDLQHEKKAYLKRKQEEEESSKYLRRFNRALDEAFEEEARNDAPPL